jgi:hypothetical protein
MPTPTYTALATITLASTASSVTFGSIPATYRDLVVVFDGLATANQAFRLRINTDSGSNYPYVYMRSQGNTPESGNGTATEVPFNLSTTTSGTRCMSLVQIMDYSATDKHKTCLVRANYDQPAVGRFVEAQAVRWSNTAAITSLQVSSASNLGAGSRIDIYGIVS